jgi:hypothetical protein
MKKQQETARRPKRRVERPVRLRRIGWFEEYHCGCVSDTERFKKDLLGYCGKHGDNRRRAYPEYEQPNASN